MAGFARLFSTRTPGVEADGQLTALKSSHVLVVTHEGHFYLLPVRNETRDAPLSVSELQQALSQIQLHSQLRSSPAAPLLAPLTAAPRPVWARVRQAHLLADPANCRLLELLEASLFALHLHPDEAPSAPTPLLQEAFGLGPHQRQWLDKSFQITVFRTGSFAATVERAAVEPHVFDAFWEWVLAKARSPEDAAADAGGNLPLPASLLPFKPVAEPAFIISSNPASLAALPSPDSPDVHIVALRWSLTPKLAALCHDAAGYAAGYASDFAAATGRLRIPSGVLRQEDPSVLVQLIMQLAFSRASPMPGLLQQVVPTNTFYRGGHDLMLSLTPESSSWVHAMNKPDSSSSSKLAVFRDAVSAHVRRYSEVAKGQGMVNYLEALHTLAQHCEARNNTLLRTLHLLHSSPALRSICLGPGLQSLQGVGIFCSPIATDSLQVSYRLIPSGVEFSIASSIASSINPEAFIQTILDCFHELRTLLESNGT